MAEGEGFEPPVPFPVQRFSRPPVSTTHTSLRVRPSIVYIDCAGLYSQTGLFLRCAAAELFWILRLGGGPRTAMKFDHFQSGSFPFIERLGLILLALLLMAPCALAQDQGGGDSSTSQGNQSWTATTQQQLPSNLNPTRTSETHTQNDGRTLDNQSIQALGTDGHYSPYLD